MTKQEWRNSKKTIEKSRKNYSHFDYRTDISKCNTYISNPQNICKHRFYPFIHYVNIFYKYNKAKGKFLKERDICYAAHLDSCIYQYYSFILNEKYNEKTYELGIPEVAVAYRNNLHYNNIELSHKAFDFIRNNSPCYVMIGDFTGFFDNINHNYLKEQWQKLFQVSQLEDDHYAVFKNITKYSKFELSDLLKINGFENNKKGRKQLNSTNKVLTDKQFRENRSLISKNKLPYGIPQGSPISATLANIYMIEIDKQIFDIVNQANGLYMRYSDDFIIIVPESNKTAINDVLSVFNNKKVIQLEPEKTQFYNYNDQTITNCGTHFIKNANNKKSTIDFLGFTFDGEKICIRQKTISKYYYRMNKKASTIRSNDGYTNKGNKISCVNLYKKYSIRGAYASRGNFLTYVNRINTEYADDDLVENITKRHMAKINKALNK